ncbi:hypothetical protein UlMin_010824 [Ulmus minor]
MSTDAVTGESKPFFCHKCDRTVTLPRSAWEDPSCPLCNDFFLEEQDYGENPNPSITQEQENGRDPNPTLAQFNEALATVDLLNPSIFSATSRQAQPASAGSDFDPLHFLQNHIQQLVADGATFEVVVRAANDLPNNIGDYFVGPGLEDFIQMLAENDPNRYGPPAAAKSAIENLPTITVGEEQLNSEMNQCAVCQDEFERGGEVKQLPCNHIYHKDCILPWLERHNSCPVCRFELPTDDPDYEDLRRALRANLDQSNARNEGSGGAESQENRRAHRRFRISMPYPLPDRNPPEGN